MDISSCEDPASPPTPHLGVLADGAASRSGGDVVREVGGHEHGVSGREGAGLTVANARVDQMGAFARAAAVTADGHVEGCRGWRRCRCS